MSEVFKIVIILKKHMSPNWFRAIEGHTTVYCDVFGNILRTIYVTDKSHYAPESFEHVGNLMKYIMYSIWNWKYDKMNLNLNSN